MQIAGRVRAQSQDQQPSSQQMEAMKQAMEDPEVRERMAAMQEQMQRPEVQQQMSAMQAAMADPQLQQRLQQLQGDPEFKQMFEDIQRGGMGALMKYWNDPDMLRKLGEKMGDVAPAASAAAAASPMPAAAVEPEVNDLFDAAKYGDDQAVEDFLAVGKDVNMQDAEQRTPLHYAAAHDHAHIVRALLEAGASTSSRDTKENSPLHYAAGYGRVDIVEIMLEGGADVTLKNATGKTAADLARLNPQNPVLGEADLMARLDAQ